MLAVITFNLAPIHALKALTKIRELRTGRGVQEHIARLQIPDDQEDIRMGTIIVNIYYLT